MTGLTWRGTEEDAIYVRRKKRETSLVSICGKKKREKKCFLALAGRTEKVGGRPTCEKEGKGLRRVVFIGIEGGKDGGSEAGRGKTSSTLVPEERKGSRKFICHVVGRGDLATRGKDNKYPP